MFLLKIIPRLKSSGKHDLICQIFLFTKKKEEIINKKVKCKDYILFIFRKIHNFKGT